MKSDFAQQVQSASEQATGASRATQNILRHVPPTGNAVLCTLIGLIASDLERRAGHLHALLDLEGEIQRPPPPP